MIRGRGTRFIGMDTRNLRKQIQNISWGNVFVYIKHKDANGLIIQELYSSVNIFASTKKVWHGLP